VGGQEVMGLSSWSLLGAILAVFVGFGAYMYGGLDTRSANQAGVEEFVIPELEAAQPEQHSEEPSHRSANQAGVAEFVIPELEAPQPEQHSEEPSQSIKNSSLGAEAAEHALSAEDILPISNGSGSTEPSTGSAVPTETPSSAPPLPVQAAGVTTLADSCTSQVWCANPAQQIPIQGNVPTENASSSTGDDGEDFSSKTKPSKEKTKKKVKHKQGEDQKRD
jgi:hypothetical protein